MHEETSLIIWLLSNVVIGLAHIIAFLAIWLNSEYSDRSTDADSGSLFGKLKAFFMPIKQLGSDLVKLLSGGVLYAYTITLLATNIGQLVQQMLVTGMSSDMRASCYLNVALGGFLILLAAMMFTSTQGPELLAEESSREGNGYVQRASNPRIALLSSFMALISITLSFRCYLISAQLLATD